MVSFKNRFLVAAVAALSFALSSVDVYASKRKREEENGEEKKNIGNSPIKVSPKKVSPKKGKNKHVDIESADLNLLEQEQKRITLQIERLDKGLRKKTESARRVELLRNLAIQQRALLERIETIRKSQQLQVQEQKQLNDVAAAAHNAVAIINTELQKAKQEEKVEQEQKSADGQAPVPMEVDQGVVLQQGPASMIEQKGADDFDALLGNGGPALVEQQGQEDADIDGYEYEDLTGRDENIDGEPILQPQPKKNRIERYINYNSQTCKNFTEGRHGLVRQPRELPRVPRKRLQSSFSNQDEQKPSVFGSGVVIERNASDADADIDKWLTSFNRPVCPALDINALSKADFALQEIELRLATARAEEAAREEAVSDQEVPAAEKAVVEEADRREEKNSERKMEVRDATELDQESNVKKEDKENKKLEEGNWFVEEIRKEEKREEKRLVRRQHPAIELENSSRCWKRAKAMLLIAMLAGAGAYGMYKVAPSSSQDDGSCPEGQCQGSSNSQGDGPCPNGQFQNADGVCQEPVSSASSSSYDDVPCPEGYIRVEGGQCQQEVKTEAPVGPSSLETTSEAESNSQLDEGALQPDEDNSQSDEANLNLSNPGEGDSSSGVGVRLESSEKQLEGPVIPQEEVASDQRPLANAIGNGSNPDVSGSQLVENGVGASSQNQNVPQGNSSSNGPWRNFLDSLGSFVWKRK